MPVDSIRNFDSVKSVDIHFENLSSRRKNNFDLIRLVLALSVCFVHIYELSELTSLKFLTKIFSSPIAVKCFFIISGYLIFMSFDKTSDIFQYCEKRIRRIFPAYFVVVVFSAVILPIYFGSFHGDNAQSVIRYIGYNLIYLNFLAPDLPLVFTENRVTAVNGALWTLKIEIMFYVTVPLIVFFFTKFKQLNVLVFVYFLSLVYFYLLEYAAAKGVISAAELQRQLPGQLTYFVAGGFLYYNFEKFMRWSLPLNFCCFLALIITPTFLLPVFEPIALAIIVLSLSYLKYLGNFSKYGDFSYGIYIVHFPIIQTLVSIGLPAQGGLVFALTAIALTGLFAIALWHGVEKWFLKRNAVVGMARFGG